VRTLIRRMSPLTTMLSMPVQVKKHMDGLMLCFFNFVNVRYGTLLLLFTFFQGMLCSMEWLT
jgi:hypothetical protein